MMRHQLVRLVRAAIREDAVPERALDVDQPACGCCCGGYCCDGLSFSRREDPPVDRVVRRRIAEHTNKGLSFDLEAEEGFTQ